MKPFVIGITGGSGSGKTIVARTLIEKVGISNVILLQHDSYYRDLSHLTFEEREKKNFDHPDALENELFKTHLKTLIEKKPINVPLYDYVTHTRKNLTKYLEPKNIIIAEGNFILFHKGLRELLDLKIFLNADPDIRFIRRLIRDLEERERSIESIIEQYLSSVRKMHIKFIEPTIIYADLIVDNNDELDEAIKIIWNNIKCRV